MMIEDALENFLKDRKRRCTPRIVEWYSSHIRMFQDWLAQENVTALESITLDHLERYLQSIRERERLTRAGKMSPVTINKRMQAIRTFLKWSCKMKFIPANPATELVLPKVGRRLPKCLTPEQVQALLDSAMTARERAIVYLTLDSGLRLSEVCALTLDDLDLKRCVAHVRHGKGDKERYVVFADEARTALEEYLQMRLPIWEDRAVFWGLQGPLKPVGIYKLIKRVASRTGIELHPHMLRHTFATQYLDAGGSLVDLRDLMGHTDIKTTTIYISVSLDRLREKHKSLSLLHRQLGDGRTDGRG